MAAAVPRQEQEPRARRCARWRPAPTAGRTASTPHPSRGSDEPVKIVEAAAAENAEYHCNAGGIPIMESPPYDIIEYLVAHGAYVEAARIAPIAASCGARSRFTSGSGASSMPCRWRCRWAIAAWPCAWRWTRNLPARATEIADAHHRRRRSGARSRTPSPTAAASSRRRAPPSARGDWPRAAALYRRASAPIDEARARARAGELREAGLHLRTPGGAGEQRRGRRGAAGARAPAQPAGPPRGGGAPPAGRRPHARAADRRAARAVRAAAGARLPRRRRRGGGRACARTSRRCRARPRTSSRSRRRRRRPPRATAAAGQARRRRRDRRRAPLRASAGCWAAAPPAASTRRSTRCWACPSRSSCCQLGGAPADPERQAYLRFAREAEAAGRPAPPEHRRASRRAAGVRACSCSS